MVRRFAEVVYIGLEDGARPDRPARPAVFRWRGQRYVVNEVLGHWRERRAWWAGGAEQVLGGLAGESAPDGLATQDLAVVRGQAKYPEDPKNSGHLPAQRPWAQQLGEEYEVWRVEAYRQYGSVPGVYDLCHDTHAPAGLTTWRLLRLVD